MHALGTLKSILSEWVLKLQCNVISWEKWCSGQKRFKDDQYTWDAFLKSPFIYQSVCS